MPDINSVEEAIASAIESESGEETQEETNEEEGSEEQIEETMDDESDESDESDDSDDEEESAKPDYGLEEDKIKDAVNLYKTLHGNDNVSAVKHIARQLGIELAEDYDVVEEEAPVAKSSTGNFKEILESKLGDRLKFMATPIAEAFEEFSKTQKNEVAQVREDISVREFRKECSQVIKEYTTEHNIPDTLDNPVSKKINELAGKYKFTGSTSKEFREYFAEMHDLALVKLGKSKDKPGNSARADKIKRNLDSKEPESAGNIGSKGKKLPPKEYTAEEAVAAALRGEDWNS
jgi:hypothetical protein